jgi:hypothetical protein
MLLEASHLSSTAVHSLSSTTVHSLYKLGFRRIKPLVISGKLSKINKLRIKILRQAKGFDIKLKKKAKKA